MNRIVSTSVLCLLLAACGAQESKTETRERATAILGGEDATGQEVFAKSIVGIIDTEAGALCTGSLIAPNIVLTAAHCVSDFPDDETVVQAPTTNIQVRFGLEVRKSPIALVRQADAIVVNPKWFEHFNDEQNTGDLALVHFEGTLPDGYQPITLAHSREDLFNGENAVLAGYGITDGVLHTGAGRLRFVNIPLADVNFSDTEVRLDQTAGKGACHGDSGGPGYLVQNGQYVLWGVTSRGLGEGDKAVNCQDGAAYTNVTAYLDWIEATVKTI
ncbi:MAG: serine protease [Bdellovibrionales bacterium]|nr:serine protease [Bdellovibrionales bacterium]